MVRNKSSTSQKRSISVMQRKAKQGVIYLIANSQFKKNLFKIGYSTRSAVDRAKDLNSRSRAGTPGTFEAIYECFTLDCKQAEREVHQMLAKYRQEKEWFKVEKDYAISVIEQACASSGSRIHGLPLKMRLLRGILIASFFASIVFMVALFIELVS